VTVGEVIQQYLADAAARVKPRTLRTYNDFLRPFAAEHGRLSAAQLAPTLAESYCRRPGWSDATRCGFLGTLTTAFRWAERSRLVDRNPLAGVRRPAKPSRGAKALIAAEEHARLLAAATPQFRLFLVVLHDTGCRPGEAASITAENFDAVAKLVRLAEHKTARLGKTRTIFLTDATAELLSRQRERFPSGPLLRNGEGGPWKRTTLVKAMATARRRAGVPHAICYGYRHTFATDGLERGVPDAQVAELLGHSGTATLHRHYSHLAARAAALREAANRVRGDAPPLPA
jgi:integrase